MSVKFSKVPFKYHVVPKNLVDPPPSVVHRSIFQIFPPIPCTSYPMHSMYLILCAPHVPHTLCTLYTSYPLHPMYPILYAHHVPHTLFTPCISYPMYLTVYVPHVPGTVVQRLKMFFPPPPLPLRRPPAALPPADLAHFAPVGEAPPPRPLPASIAR